MTLSPRLQRQWRRSPAPAPDHTSVDAPEGVSTRIKVAFLVRSLNRGGTERQLATLATRLDPRMFEIEVWTFYPGGPFWSELAGANHIALRTLAKRGRWENIGTCRRLAHALRDSAPDIIHCYLTEPSIIGLIAARLARIEHVIWGVRASNVDYSTYGRIEWLTFKAAAILSRFADLIIVNSQAGRAHHVAQGYSPRRFVTIPNGIDTDAFRPLVNGRNAVRERWGVGPADIVMGVPARLDPMKGHITLLHAVKEVGHPSLKVVCAGGGTGRYASELRALAGHLALTHRIVWIGEQSDMPTVYSGLDFACLPSTFGEGFSNAVAEAMACAVPCIVTDVGDCAKIVGETGMVVPPEDPHALTRAIENMAALQQNERAGLGDRARRRIQECFGVDRMVAQTAAAYRTLVAGEHGIDLPATR